jgi:nucleotide-binding universal stress UspA family protein
MSGITVGVDGSGNAQPALDWAMNEAVMRKLPLTVVTVHEVPASYWVPGRPVVFPGDNELLAKARQAAEEAVTDAAKRLESRARLRASAPTLASARYEGNDK